MRQHRTPEELADLQAQAAAMRADGIGAKRIASALGIGHSLTRELLRDVPVPGSLMRLRAKDEHREAAILRRQQGRTYDEIRDELGVSKGSLSLWLRDLARPTEEQRRAAVAGGKELPSPEGPPDREVARALRADGWLLREIASELQVSLPTVHRWCRGLPVPPRAVHGRSPEESRAMGRLSWDRRLAERETERQGVHAAAAATVGRITDRDLDALAAVAYWCEGAKRKPWNRVEHLTFVNSDPDLIRLWLEWLRRRDVTPERWRLSLSIHESADVAQATRFWSEVTGRPLGAFGKPSLKRHNPRTVRKNTGATYVGCLVVRVLGSRLLYQEIEGLWRGVVQGAVQGEPHSRRA